jgi:outer membrane biosynthesis protein TonB
MSVERRASGSSRDMVTAPKTRLVQKQPHLLAYITPAEAALLKENGGTGEMVNGIPAFRKGGGRSDRGRSSSPKSEKKSSPAPKERNDRQPVAKSKPAPAPKERNDRQPVAKPAPAPKERNDRQPVAKPAPAPKTLTRSITVPLRHQKTTVRQPRKKLRQQQGLNLLRMPRKERYSVYFR